MFSGCMVIKRAACGKKPDAQAECVSCSARERWKEKGKEDDGWVRVKIQGWRRERQERVGPAEEETGGGLKVRGRSAAYACRNWN